MQDEKNNKEPNAAPASPKEAVQPPKNNPAPEAAAPDSKDAASPAQPKKEESEAKKIARPANCAACNKSIRKKCWYYKNGKYYCTKRCWKTTLKKKEAAGSDEKKE